MGTPYGGSPIAKLAALGKVFGVTCGANDDLTVKGAERWRRMIPSSAQRQVFFYTTQVSWYTFIHFCISAFITHVCVYTSYVYNIMEHIGGSPDVMESAGSKKAVEGRLTICGAMQLVLHNVVAG